MSSFIIYFQFKSKCSEFSRLQFVILHTKMFESAPTHGEDCTCILLVTLTNFSDEWVGSDAANRWATNIVRAAVSKTYQKLEGDLVQVIPLNSTVAGKRFKLKFVGVPELLIADIVMPAFQKLGQVKKVSSEEEMARGRPETARRRAQAIGDVDKVSTFMENSWTCEDQAEAT